MYWRDISLYRQFFIMLGNIFTEKYGFIKCKFIGVEGA